MARLRTDTPPRPQLLLLLLFLSPFLLSHNNIRFAKVVVDGFAPAVPCRFKRITATRRGRFPSSQLRQLQQLDTSSSRDVTATATSATTTGLFLSSSAATAIPRMSGDDLAHLSEKGYVIIDDFLPDMLQESLRQDVRVLRTESQFKTAKIGQDSTNTLNTEIRVAETCFLGRNKLKNNPNPSRSTLYDILDQLRVDLSAQSQSKQSSQPLDSQLSEFLYAYYPQGGFYRRHRDAIPGTASTLRKYSLLLYLNDKSWTAEADGGRLRMHMDSGGDFLPEGETPNFIDVDPKGGTLVLFDSDKLPHEVLDTKSERFAIVGWYNRQLVADDIMELSGAGGDQSLGPVRVAALAVAAGLVTVGLVTVLGGG